MNPVNHGLNNGGESGLAGKAWFAVSAWCEGRYWPLRALLLAWLSYVGVRHLVDPGYTSLFGGINLGIHEAGHVVTGCMGQFICAAAGTVFQLAAPLFSAAMFLKMRDYFAMTVCGAWLSDNLYGVALYVGDARAMELDLVSVGGGDAYHDWNYLLDMLGLLPADSALAALLRIAAFAVMWASVAAGGAMCVAMMRRPGTRTPGTKE